MYEDLHVRDSYSCRGAVVQLEKEDAYIHQSAGEGG